MEPGTSHTLTEGGDVRGIQSASLLVLGSAKFRRTVAPPFATARLAQSVEHETLNLRVVGSSPTLGAAFVKLVREFRFLRVEQAFTES